MESHQWEEDRDPAWGGEGRPRCMGVGRSGNEMRRWSWWSLKTKGSEGESPHLKDDRGFLVFGMKVI